MAGREKEYVGLDKVEIFSGTLDDHYQHTNNVEGPYKCLYSKGTIQLKPMDTMGRQHIPKWSTSNFHSDLVLADATENGLVVMLEAMARECVSIILFPGEEPKCTMGSSTYEIVFGARGNTVTVVSRQQKSSALPIASSKNRISGSSSSLSLTDSATTITNTSSQPGRVCQERAWTSYWVCYSQRKVYAGIGQTPDERLVAILDDVTPSEEDGPLPLVGSKLYVGLGNTAVADRQRPRPIKVRNIRLLNVSDDLRKRLADLVVTDVDLAQLAVGDVNTADDRLLSEYQTQVNKARARAAKFNVPFVKPPPVEAFLSWSQARKLWANPSPGFMTGLDLQDPAEQLKQEARQKRFGLAKETPPEANFGMVHEMEILPIGQAWDNQVLIGEQRMDLPPELWKSPPVTVAPLHNEFRNQPLEEAAFAPEKIHIFSIDWAAFKQIRTTDIMSHFSSYGPSYVEWLGDLCCNVLFEDKFTAARALENLSLELPSPPATEIKSEAPSLVERSPEASPMDLGNMRWRFGKTMLRKIANDRFGRRGTSARLLMRLATNRDVLEERPSTWPKPPPGFTTKRILGPGSDFPDLRRAESPYQRKGGSKRSRGNDFESPVVVKSNGEPTLLDGGLSSSRKGFSVEEMEVERAQKRARVVFQGVNGVSGS